MLTLTIVQKIVLSISFYYYIFIGIIVFASVLSIISASVYLFRRRRFRGLIGGLYVVEHQANIDHFEAYMPEHSAPESHGEPLVCPICLQNIKHKDKIRKTPCEHTFHTPCLDCWCYQKLACPVCRSDFSIDKIGDISKQTGPSDPLQ